VDANGKWDLHQPAALLRLQNRLIFSGLKNRFGYDDIKSHCKLAQSTSIPIALGEQLDHTEALTHVRHAGAVHFVNRRHNTPGGITEYSKLLMRRTASFAVAAHIGDMGLSPAVILPLGSGNNSNNDVGIHTWISHCLLNAASVENAFIITRDTYTKIRALEVRY